MLRSVMLRMLFSFKPSATRGSTSTKDGPILPLAAPPRVDIVLTTPQLE